MGEEVFVDGHLGAVQLDWLCLLPGGPIGWAAWFAAPQHEQVGHHGGASGSLVGAARQADRAGQVGQRGDFPARGRVAGVHREPGGEHGHHSPGPDQVQRLDDEVVVDAVPGWVVPPVVQCHVPERHVPDRQVKTAVAVAAVGERLGADLRVRVQQASDPRGHRVQLDPGHLGGLRCERDEVAAAAARFEHPACAEAERLDSPPYRLDDRGVGVVGVQRVPPRGRQLSGGQQAGELLSGPGELGAAFVEDLRDRTPSRPAGQYLLLGGRRRAVLPLAGAQHRQRGEVGADPADRTRRGQVVLAAGPEGRYCGRVSPASGSGGSKIISVSTICSARCRASPSRPALSR